MWVSAPLSKLISVVAAFLISSTATSADQPGRVVSINLCTDQMAMLVAAPGQLHSVSFLARDPRSSAMTREAEAYVINHSRAEEIYLMRPDLVLAGRFSSRATVEMLRRLSVPVVIFDPAYSLTDVRERLFQVGEALGQQQTATALVEEFDQRLEALRNKSAHKPRAALYYANGYTSGDKTLAGQILVAAGFSNAAIEAGFVAGGNLPLEVLAMLEPDAVITAERYPAASRSEEILDHPVVQALRGKHRTGSLTDHDWVCGTPFVLRAIEDLATIRKDLTQP